MSLQFAISIGLAIVALVVFAQIRFSQQENLGFNRSHILVIRNFANLPAAKRADFQQTLEADPSVAGTAQSGSTPFEGCQSLEIVQLPGSPQHLTADVREIGPHYARVYQLRLLAGRFLSAEHAQDLFTDKDGTAANVVITEAAARLFGYGPQEAIGKTFRKGQHRLTIIGVVDNLRLAGPQAKVAPIILEYDRDLPELSVRIRPGQTRQALAAISHDWRHFAPNTVMDLHFLDATFDSLFRADQQRERIFSVFVTVAILVACLGLYSLAAFATQRRTQEIGIRKVFGAGVWDIVWLLLWQCSVPVLLANIVAWPIAWYYLTVWLQSFASRIWLSPVYFVAAGVVALAIAWLTVATHAVAAAHTRPTRALRCE